MAQIRTPLEILEIAKISQYLSFNDKANKQFLKGGAIDNRLPTMITCERLSVQWTYDTDPVDSTLRGTSNYLFGLLGLYALQAQNILTQLDQDPPVVTGPTNQSVNVGEDATFTISVVSTLNYTIQWQLNGVDIPGATSLSYIVLNAQLVDSGGVYSAVVTNAAGVGYSANATLTVTEALEGRALYSQTDPYPYLERGLNLEDWGFTWQITFPITNLDPLSVTFPNTITALEYIAVEYPATQMFKTLWSNTAFNFGQIPDSVMGRIQLIGDKFYICTRQGQRMTIDYNFPMIFSGNVAPYPFQFITQPIDVTVASGVPFTLTALVGYGKANYDILWTSSGGNTVFGNTSDPEQTLFWNDTVTKTWYLTVTDSELNVIVSNTVTVTII